MSTHYTHDTYDQHVDSCTPCGLHTLPRAATPCRESLPARWDPQGYLPRPAPAPSPGRLPELRTGHRTPHPSPPTSLGLPTASGGCSIFQAPPHMQSTWLGLPLHWCRVPTPQTHTFTHATAAHPLQLVKGSTKSLSWDSKRPREALAPLPQLLATEGLYTGAPHFHCSPTLSISTAALPSGGTVCRPLPGPPYL